MKRFTLTGLAALTAVSAYALPVSLDEAGLTPLTDIIIATEDPIGNGGDVESIGIGIMTNGNIIVGWEDDANLIAAGYLVYTPDGTLLTPEVRSYANDDGSPTANNGGWGPKIHANMYGDGAVFSSTYYDWIGVDDGANNIPSLNGLGDEDGPAVQIVNNDGTFSGVIIPGLGVDFMERDGGIRIGDAEMLSDGNIVVIGENRQSQDAAELFGLTITDRHVVAAVVAPDRTIVAGPVLVQEADVRGSIWHGVATFDGGFLVRYELQGVGIGLRGFDNDLTPLFDEVLMPDVAPDLNAGGRGDGAGFKGNGMGDFVMAAQSGRVPYVGVFNADGTVKVAPQMADEPLDEAFGIGADRVDAAIDEAGNYVVVYRDQNYIATEGLGTVVARFFNADGTPAMDPVILTNVTEETVLAEDRRPRVAIRGGIVAVAWEDANVNERFDDRDVALRVFESPFEASEVPTWELY